MRKAGIGLYQLNPPACHDYDPRVAEVAHRVARLITARLPTVRVEHIVSTAVPGCAGKGIVDLMVLYPEGQLEAAKEALAALGFQRQTVGHLFPETRPMRVGAVTHAGHRYRLHVHVVAATAAEAAEARAFRDRLRADPQLRAAYTACNREILARGVTDPAVYTGMKGRFVQEVLASGRPHRGVENGAPHLVSP